MHRDQLKLFIQLYEQLWLKIKRKQNYVEIIAYLILLEEKMKLKKKE